MAKPLCRNNGLYQWDAKVAGARAGKARETVNVTVFCDTRQEAIDAASSAAGDFGFLYCTVNHITKID